ncbi:MAG TPA: undecaprenyldiphospho-muramoylpentapeptide beta-N-acetylglucosaminyltransferase [Candidatus Cloacimonas sp.]|jgi:UDP-N-acetylglucosamine--N-acetylmuramyl-(pentapeptide) pyrophosphoryl-undecaprenol N-acetylglucosamine transferase|nr:undecaprenyldiphospho-muramoylpentapeptide beta-N-acetylglucosaminyltransferase [Candidatus Cloacimonas sp.]MCK9157922.1 undecaprenyldiphospho-muramoylpentapeptide beta-N-acetylglucosaminyltransferase [Candidatus Cloacimonas sp.]MCK9164647.1 undecaprenyldiphospho-muramoylpentapeptide beta-N-acetylglucosaminyltransferase [Candidatus Cloacimonas sp.]HQP63182.1 undecaprenyldiphospho-muramoylpentapeptide beta-N-acetylglucosaminyltransferase [Candidatus Cloacimonas sp.]HRR50587.1 undecaprenyldiph
MKFIFGAGGTGGHITPALALADELQKYNHDILFIGNRNSIEESLCKSAGYPIRYIKVQKLYRSFKLENLVFPFFLASSIIAAINILKKEKPQAVICTGGFVAGPTAIAASLLKVPLFFHESNSYPGLVTRKMAKKINTIFISFENSKKYLVKAKTVNYGIPLRQSKISSTQKTFELSSLGLDNNKPTIIVSGGSQGSIAINTVVSSAIPVILSMGYQIIWQTGKTSYERFATKHKNTEGVYMFAFSPELPKMLSKCKLAITRAGAMTIAELEENCIPAILIPLPTAAENHQYYNALAQQEKGVAMLLEQKDLSLLTLVESLKKMSENLAYYQDNLFSLPKNQAAEKIVHYIINYLQNKGE